jgi:hypothetical protein
MACRKSDLADKTRTETQRYPRRRDSRKPYISSGDADVRTRTCAGVDNLGIRLDSSANLSEHRGERTVSDSVSRVKMLVIPTNEELEIALVSFETITKAV